MHTAASAVVAGPPGRCIHGAGRGGDAFSGPAGVPFVADAVETGPLGVEPVVFGSAEVGRAEVGRAEVVPAQTDPAEVLEPVKTDIVVPWFGATI